MSPLHSLAAGLAGWIALPAAALSSVQVVLYLLLTAFLASAAEEIIGGDDGEA